MKPTFQTPTFSLFAAVLTLCVSACGGPLSSETSTADKTSQPAPASDLSSTSQQVLNGWTAYASEEFAPIGCGAGSLINKMRCSGSYCDNVGASCVPTTTAFADTWWTSYFSEESTNNRICDAGYWMTGLVCRGGNCDDISIQCTRVTNRTIGTCRWADRTFSEEFPNEYALPTGWFARGLACTGSRCDNLRVYECQLN